MGSICCSQREREFSISIERLLELQRDLVIKETELFDTQKKLEEANKLLQKYKINEWNNSTKNYDKSNIKINYSLL